MVAVFHFVRQQYGWWHCTAEDGETESWTWWMTRRGYLATVYPCFGMTSLPRTLTGSPLTISPASIVRRHPVPGLRSGTCSYFVKSVYLYEQKGSSTRQGHCRSDDGGLLY